MSQMSCMCYDSRGAVKNNEKGAGLTGNNQQMVRAMADSEAGISL